MTTIEFVNSEEFLLLLNSYLSHNEVSRFLKRRIFMMRKQTIAIFKINVGSSIFYFLVDFSKNKIYTTHKKIISGIKDNIAIGNLDELLYLIFSRILDHYAQDLTKISHFIFKERKNLFENKLIQLRSIDKLLDKLDDLEDNIMILRTIYRNTIQDRSILMILAEDSLQILDEIKELREKIKFLLDLQINIQQNRLDKRMEKLTLLSTIFLPATLISSIYGMNFIKVFPSWKHPYGFLIALSTIFLSSLFTYIFIMKKLSQSD